MDIVSCGGSGTFPYCIRQPGVTQVQMGGAIFSDVHYRTHFISTSSRAAAARFCHQPPDPDAVVLDAGKKSMSSDAAVPAPQGVGAVKAVQLSAEHGTIELEQPSATPAVGDKVEFIVGYGDTTVHLHEEIITTRAGRMKRCGKSPRGDESGSHCAWLALPLPLVYEFTGIDRFDHW